MTDGQETINYVPSDGNCAPCFGLTKREYFAAMAMQGILASDGRWSIDKEVALFAVHQADHLIEELNK
jgi:hypothetical protein